MNTGKLTRMVLAVCFIGMMQTVRAQNNLTQQILHKQIFREGLVCLTNTTPTEAENRELLEVVSHLQESWWTAGLEQFFKDYPDSAWAPSLHYDYAAFCRRTGRTTKALEQFAAAWALLKDNTSPQGRRLGGAVLANWTDLLASLGRAKELKPLIAAGDNWPFVNANDRNKFQGAKNSYYLILMHPEMAFRCGTFALKAVGGKLEPGDAKLESLVQVPSPTNGFSMAGLEDLAKQYGLNLVPVRRTAGQELVVPSVVHWRQNHYAAILDHKDNLYLVSDPTFGGEKWVPAEVINEESSGEFLIPATAATNGWQELAQNDASSIHGMGLPGNVKDGKDKYKKPDCPPKGMPVWWVSEPYINLWISDEPLSYLTSRGDPFTFRITYKQRDSRPTPSDHYVSNSGWNNSWASYVRLDSTTPCYNTGTGCMPSLGGGSATVFLPNGGEVDFNPGQTYDSETRMSLQTQAPVGLQRGADYGDNGLRLVHADGSQDIYGVSLTIPVPYGDDAEAEFLRTRHLDPHGDTTWFEYDAVNGGPYDLMFVIDPDGRTNILSYGANNLLSSVTNGYGQSAHFKWDASGNLTNIVDAQGLSSSLTYDTNGYPTKLITPYGTNRFDIFVNATVADTNNGEGNFGGHNLIDRAVLATDPVGAKRLYLYRYDSSSFMDTTWPSGTVPTGTPLGTLDDGSTGTNFLTGICYRNSFFWGPRQYEGLSTTNMDDFTANDYLRGRLQHWLEDTNQLDLTGYLSVQRDPSPDGSTPGLLTFYDYQGKLSGYNFCAGTSALPSVEAWRLPNGETHYEYKLFDYFGNVTNDITTYTKPDGSLGTRTNQFVYADNTYTFELGTWDGSNIINPVSSSYTIPDLLTKVIGADGNPIWSYGGFDSVTWTNFFYKPGQTNITLLTALRVSPDYATNGVGWVTTNTFTLAGGPVTPIDLYKGAGFYTNFNYSSPWGTTFPGGGKLSSVTTPAGLTTTNIYSASGFLSQTISLPIGRTNSFGYTTDGLIGGYTNALNLGVTATWDNLMRLTAVHFPDGTYVSNAFDKLDLGGFRDRLGHWTYYGHDGVRHLTTITNADTNITTYTWCGCGALESIVDAETNLTAFDYDNAGNLTNIDFPDYSSLGYQYNLAGQVTNVFDGADRFLRLAYNNQGLITNVAGAYGTLRAATFDVRDRPISITDANGIMVTNTFDKISELLTRTWPDGIGESFGYNPAGLMAYTNRDQRATYYGRDAAGRLTSVTNANTEITRFGYNPLNEITSLTDGLTHTRSWQYNEYGWLTNKIDGLTRNAFRYQHNANGWVTNRWTPEKGNTGYTYDNVGNLKTIAYPSSTVNYSYNAVNWLTNMVDASGTNQFTYTATGQLKTEDGPWGSDTVTYTYSQGLRTALDIGGLNQTYGYDSMWRMTNVISWAGTFGYSYNFQPASSLVTGIRLPNGASITNSYNPLAQLTGTALENYWGHTLDGYAYLPDALGLRTNIVRTLGLTSSTVSVGFDKIGQITSWLASETNGTARMNERLGWAYDAAHNLHTRTNDDLVQTFTTDAADQLTSVTRTGTFTLSGATPAPATSVTVNGNAAQTYGDFTFARTNNSLADGNNTFAIIAQNAYSVKVTNNLTLNLPQSVTLHSDANGNLTNDGLHSLAYDAENQLTNITVAGSWKSDFVYDGLNRRRIEQDYSWSGSAWTKTNETHFVYDGYQLVQERDAANDVLVTYTRGLDLSSSLSGAGGIGGLLARTDANGSAFYHADGVGNITALIDSQENIVARYLYGPAGKLIGQWGTLAEANGMRFSSMPERGGLVLYPFRAYSPNLQRWLTVDPLGELGGYNLYRHTYNSPVNLVDKDGRILPLLIAAFVVGAVLAEEPANAPGPNDPTEPMLSFPQHLEAGAGAALVAGATAGLVKGGGAAVDSLSGDFPKSAPTSCPKNITVIGSGKDVAPFVDKPGFNTFTGEGIPAAELDRENALWLNDAIQNGDQIWLVTDPEAHANFLESLPGQPQSAYLNLELPMLNEYSGVNAIPQYATSPGRN